MKNEEVFITNSFEETQKVGEDFVKRSHLCQGATLTARVIALHGDLGGGKTTFTQGIAKGLGVGKRIISPTFVIVRQYKLKKRFWTHSVRQNDVILGIRQLAETPESNVRTINFYHIDLYRVGSKNDIEGLGIEEILNNPENIVVIEWAERLGDLLPEERVDVYFEYIDEEKRKITIKNFQFEI